jgi:hypothetical protein
MPYADVLTDPSELPPGWQPLVRNRFVPSCENGLIDTVSVATASVGMLFAELRSLGGAVRRIPPEATAFAHRGSEALP